MLRPSTARGIPAFGIAHERQHGCRAHGFNGGEDGGGASGAVDSDGGGSPLGEQRGGLLGRGTVEATAFVVDSDHHEDGKVRGDGFGGLKGDARLIESGHGLNDQQVDTAIDENLHLLAESRPRLVEAGLAQRLQPNAKRTYRTGNPGLGVLLSLQIFDCLPGQPNAGFIDLFYLSGQPVAGQADAVRAEGVGFKNLRAGLQVLFVDRDNETRIREIQLVVAAVDKDPASIEHGTHGAVGEQGAVGENLGKLGHSVDMLSHASRDTPEEWSALLYFGSHKLGSNRSRDAVFYRYLE